MATKATPQKKEYNSSSIKVLEGLDPVRQRPGMYTRLDNPNHIIQEVIDNAQDEALAGHASEIRIEIHDDGSVSVADNGRGIPTDAGASTGGRPAAEVVFTKLHAGGKFDKGDDSSYKFTGGLHGVGVSVTNALSTRLEVSIKREGKLWALAFEDGHLVEPLKVVGKAPKEETGTTVRAWPDLKYFDGKLSVGALESYLASKAVLMPQASIRFKAPGKDEQVWSYPEGLPQYLSENVGNAEPWVAPIFELERYHDGSSETFSSGEGIHLAVGWPLEARPFSASYVNLIHTPQGGKHETGLRSGLFEAMRAFIETHSLGQKGVKIEADDVWARASFVLSAKMVDPHFQGQTKDKLITDSAVRLASGLVREPFELWLNDHLEDAKKLAEMVIESAVSRTKSAAKIERKKTSGAAVLPGKLTDCESEDLERNELFLVEGDSAGGSAKMGRDKDFQAILPLRGKLLNTWEVTEAARLYASSTISDISLAIGVDPHGDAKDLDAVDKSKLRYGRIAILSDADVDGSHIQVLLLTLFFKHFPRLVRDGHIYIAQPPLFRVDAPAKKGTKEKGGQRKFYALEQGELDETLERLRREGVSEASLQVSRFKGLGEMNPDQLWETALDPDTRRMLRVGFSEKDVAQSAILFDMLMSDKNAHKRRAWMEERGHEVEGDI